MDTIVNNNKIRVKVAPYALLDVLRALYNSDVKEVTITKEDGDLILVVDTSRTFKKSDCSCTINYDENCFIMVDGHTTTNTTTINNGGV